MYQRLIDKVFGKKSSFKTYNNIHLSSSNLLNNFDEITKLTNKQLIPVLKSNAYGHGIMKIAEILNKRDFEIIAVDSYFEALRIRDVSNKKILIMGVIKPENYKALKIKRLSFVVHSLDVIEAMSKINKVFNIHIEIETGMNRHGVKISELKVFLEKIKQYKNINIEGVMSHLADSDNVDNGFTEKQTKCFDHAVEIVKEKNINPKYIHIAQSAGSIKDQSKYTNFTRSGLALYGISPLSTKDRYSYCFDNLKPVLKLTSAISKEFIIKKGESVSYNRTFIANKRTRVGILPLGYYEGVPRELSNKGALTCQNGHKLPIIGRVCMNHTMIDLSDSGLKLNDEVIIISDNKNDENSIQNLCKNNGIFSYSLLCKLNDNIRRTII